MAPKNTKETVVSWLYWLITLPLFLISAVTLCAYSIFCFIIAENGGISWFAIKTFFPITIIAFGLLILAVQVSNKTGPIREKLRRLRYPLTCVLAGFVCFLIIDAPRPEHVFTEKDIISTTPEAKASYQVIKPLIGDAFNVVDIDRKEWASAKFLTDIETHRPEIMKAWESIADKRDLIEKLNTFESITDVDPNSKITNGTEFITVKFLLNLQSIYTAYAILEIKSGHADQGLAHLTTFYNVARKGLEGSAVLINKILWATAAERIMDGAYAIASMTPSDLEINKKLVTAFIPLSDKEMSMTKILIGEYLFEKNSFEKFEQPATFLCAYSLMGCPDEPDPVKKTVSALVYCFAYQKNRMSMEFNHYFDKLFKGVHQTPPDTSDAERYLTEYTSNPTLRNLAGWLLARYYYPDSNAYVNRFTNIRTKSDILSIHLHELTHDPVVLNDHFTGKPYVLDKKENSLSTPGKDGKFETKDDVRLEFSIK